MQPVNQHLFDDQTERNRLFLIASGRSSDGYSRGGISFIQEDKVNPGEALYRVGQSTLPMTMNMSSPWWLRESAFLHIVAVAEQTQADPIEIFRRYCAVSNDFGVADTVIKVRNRLPLRAFTGRGVPVFDRAPGHDRIWVGASGTEYRGDPWMGNYNVAQLFIPGLRDFRTRLPTAICHDAMQVVERLPLTEYARKHKRQEKWVRKHL
jgi:hypothetical protein